MGTAVAKTGIESLQQFVDKNAGRISASMPAGVRAELITRSLMAAMRADPKLAACTSKSLIHCLEQMVLTGLDVGDSLVAKAYLIPYGQEAQFQIGYKGVKELVRRSGQGKLIMQDVREGDTFIPRGNDELPTFEPSLDRMRHAKPLEWVYAAYIPRDSSGPIVSVWSVERCLAHRDTYSKGYRGKKTDAWHEENPAFAVMCQKCPVMELAGRGDLPLSPDICQMVEGAETLRTVQPVAVQSLPAGTPEQIDHAPEAVLDQSPEESPPDIDWQWLEKKLESITAEKPLDDLRNELIELHSHQRQEIWDRCEEHRELIREHANTK